MSRGPRTYTEAKKRPSRDIWPGCGDGRKRPCGRIHDFVKRIGPNIYHDFRCWHNHYHGCPQPIPEPEKD